MIVGLDLSTSCTGIAVLNDDGSFHSIHYVELKKIKSFYQKVDAVLGFLVHNLQLPEDTKFYIEAPLLHFKMKASMASTLALLQKFNACVCYGIYRAFGVEPTLINVISARKLIGLDLPKKRNKKETKPMILTYVRGMNIVPEDFWKLKKTGRAMDWCFDAADAFVVAYSSFLRYYKPKTNVIKT